MASVMVAPWDLAKQVKALVRKNLLLLLTRHWLSTLLQAAVAPIAILALTLNIKNFNPTVKRFGVGDPLPIRSLPDSIPSSQHLVIVKTPSLASDVDDAIDTLTKPLPSERVVQFDTQEEAQSHCFYNFRGISSCYAIITFNDSPLTDLSQNQTWNYTLRFDPIRQNSVFNIHKSDNDYQVYWAPTQLAVDNAITKSTEVPLTYMFTTLVQKDVDVVAKVAYGELVIDTFVIVFFLSTLPGIYHAVDTITSEREAGTSQLIDAMGGSPSARVLSHILSFSMIYFPTWLIFGCYTNAAIPVFWQIFSGLAFLVASLFAASFFKRRRISSIFVIVCFCCLGGGAAILLNRRVDTARVVALSLLFPAMNYIFSLSHMARFALGNLPVDMTSTHIVIPDDSRLSDQTYFVSIYLYWIFLIIQILVYPILTIIVERGFHGLSFKGRTMASTGEAGPSDVAIRTTGLSKIYQMAWHKNLLCFGKRDSGFKALDGVDLVSQKHQILCLLGVNGAGKSTTLDLLSGFQTSTAGEMVINAGPSQLGVCPQKNVLFNRLTVLEHVKFWSEMKGKGENLQALHNLIAACDLTMKTHKQARTLSGGQKRKLQLACMFVGGTTICLMDEVTSGLDPISRRTIWDIILAERSKRSMVFTTHFLDEGEVLADHIVILSKGQIRCQGSGTELKNSLGGGYRVYLPRDADVPGIDAPRTIHQDRIVYRTPDSRSAALLVSQIEAAGCQEVQIAGPTIEDVFLGVNQDDALSDDEKSEKAVSYPDDKTTAVSGQLSSGKTTTFFQQVRILIMKRLHILPRYWAGAFLTLALPIACMPAINTFLSDKFTRPLCESPTPVFLNAQSGGFQGYVYPVLVENPYPYLLWQGLVPNPVGPSSVKSTVFDVLSSYPISGDISYPSYIQRYNLSTFDSEWQFIDDYDTFQNIPRNAPPKVVQGGIYMGDGTPAHPPTIAYNGESGMQVAMADLGLYTAVRSKVKIAASTEGVYFYMSLGDGSWQYILYAAFILAVYPAFFALYPAFEKVNKVRALQCSNGVRPLPLWAAYFLFDLLFVLAISIAYTVTITQQFREWWEPAYMFPICFLHGIAGILFSYIISNVSGSQLSAFLWTLGYNALGFFALALATTLPNLLSDPLNVERNTSVAAYVLNLFFPIGNVFRGMAIGFNLYQVACQSDGSMLAPGSFKGYGFPITYLVLQIVVLATALVLNDADLSFSLLRRAADRNATSTSAAYDQDNLPISDSASGVGEEAARVELAQQDLLRLVHVSKSFNGNPAVSDVSLGLGEGEILALLGPNGAGKTTIVNMIRGEMRPSAGHILLGDIDVSRHPRLAQKAIGVCPQFDALDLLTARQHLEFYARIKGIEDVQANVDVAMARVGLTPHADRQGADLSGGNKRKLSLAIALMGNPAVLILDEPSSSMDAAAKRKMWKTLAEIAPGRSLLLTTHSMEEADALATRAAILSQRLLAIGTTQVLRKKYNNLYNIQLVLRTAPHSAPEEMREVEAWVRKEFVDVTFEGPSLGGQIKFMVPASSPPPSSSSSFVVRSRRGTVGEKMEVEDTISAVSVLTPVEDGGGNGENVTTKNGSVGYLIGLLEQNRETLGLQDYSIGAPTLEKVFLSVVKDNHVEEEDGEGRGGWRRFLGRG
ncbi:hypothetical protein B0T17DRAFT_619068 [Bombardia bombarda]|uniref:ABC transporter domain-containing protein n=1 Tax=Bombardia bombarda TaxID=252184 RepID=A0AA39WN64_9PEZI|nr:hypothetical protein B0T17DRAFT_619068 [Bombardia bombarda]